MRLNNNHSQDSIEKSTNKLKGSSYELKMNQQLNKLLLSDSTLENNAKRRQYKTTGKYQVLEVTMIRSYVSSTKDTSHFKIYLYEYSNPHEEK